MKLNVLCRWLETMSVDQYSIQRASCRTFYSIEWCVLCISGMEAYSKYRHTYRIWGSVLPSLHI